jgi:enoyl-CoA hydratase
MDEDILIRVEGRTGRITLNRPGALNALTWEMCNRIEAALDAWAADDAVALMVIDAAGEKAFCAGGDIAEMYAAAMTGDFDYGRRFWADEYRMDAKLFNFPKPVVSFLQGFTMGGGVGAGCHASHRIVCDTSRIAMPECGIGLIPDVGGSLILARAPGRLGEYLGLTAARMGPGDAIYAGFADYLVPLDTWEGLKAELIETGDWEAVDRAAAPAPEAPLAARQAEIDALFAGDGLRDILNVLRPAGTAFAEDARLRRWRATARCRWPARSRSSAAVRGRDTIEGALELEYRFTCAGDGAGRFPRGHPRRDDRQGQRAALAA